MKHVPYDHDYHVTLSSQKKVTILPQKKHKKKKDVILRKQEIIASQYIKCKIYTLYYKWKYYSK